MLYASRSDYETYHPLLTGMSTDNGGIYIEKGATFYTYERRVPQDSTLTLEELFRHEYTHYLNGRWAVPGLFGEGPWYQGDRTTAMDEGTAEFFDGATRDQGVKVRKSLVQSIINDTAGGTKPRMSVNRLLHATYDGDGFRFYSYAGTFFEFLWTERPAQLKEMYGYTRANDVAGFDAWRARLGGDPGTQRAYDTFLDQQIAKVKDLYVPDTTFTPSAGWTPVTPPRSARPSPPRPASRPSAAPTRRRNAPVHLHGPHHRQPEQPGRRRPGLQGHVRDGRLLHPRPDEDEGNQQLRRHELLVRHGRPLARPPRGLGGLHL
ncbi:collagenase [Streptomyces stramineus]